MQAKRYDCDKYAHSRPDRDGQVWHLLLPSGGRAGKCHNSGTKGKRNVMDSPRPQQDGEEQDRKDWLLCNDVRRNLGHRPKKKQEVTSNGKEKQRSTKKRHVYSDTCDCVDCVSTRKEKEAIMEWRSE